VTRAKRKAKTLPPLPATVLTAHGDVAVVLVDDLRDPDDATKTLFGYWDPYKRTISIRVGMHPTAAWLTLFHEKTHADLSEIGVTLTEEHEEVVANAIAGARLAELLESLP
jgi:hypothetical protein